MTFRLLNISQNIAVMYYGKIVELTTSEELFKHPLHPYTKSFIREFLFQTLVMKRREKITYNPLSAHDYTKEKPTMLRSCSRPFCVL